MHFNEQLISWCNLTTKSTNNDETISLSYILIQNSLYIYLVDACTKYLEKYEFYLLKLILVLGLYKEVDAKQKYLKKFVWQFLK